MKRLKAIAVAILIILPLSAAVDDRYAMDSPYQSVAYSGRFYDMFANPAALPMMEVEPGLFALTVSASDSWNAADFGKGTMSFIQDQLWSIDATFISKYIALTASFGSEFDRVSPSSSNYDIYSSLKIELDAAYAFPHFSIGARISGGNQMVRRDKTMDNIGDVFVNACHYMVKALEEVTRACGKTIQDIDWISSHQANLRIIKTIARQSDIPEERFLMNIEQRGNTGSPSCAISLSENIEKVKPGDLVGLTVFGGGYSCGAVLLQF